MSRWAARYQIDGRAGARWPLALWAQAANDSHPSTASASTRAVVPGGIFMESTRSRVSSRGVTSQKPSSAFDQAARHTRASAVTLRAPCVSLWALSISASSLSSDRRSACSCWKAAAISFVVFPLASSSFTSSASNTGVSPVWLFQ